jgi:hypothetical protein
VQQVRPRPLGNDPAARQPVDGLPVQRLGLVAAGQQRPAAGEQAQRPRRARGRGPLREPVHRGLRRGPVPAAHAGLDEVGQREVAPVRRVVGVDEAGRVQRVGVAARAEGEHRLRGADQLDLRPADPRRSR